MSLQSSRVIIVGGSSGLGLAMAYGIVHRADGDISIQSEEGKGTCITISLDRVHPEMVSAARPPAKKPRPQNSRCRVLFVEDEPALLRIFTQALRSSGLEVDQASDAAEALRLASDPSKKFDLLITDFTLPDTDGLELARKVRTHAPQIPVLCVSGSIDPISSMLPTAEEPLNGMSNLHLLRKPFTAEELRAKVTELLGGDG